MERLEFNRPQVITAAVMMSLLPGLIWQAQDARFYAAMSACYIGAIWYAINRRPIGLVTCAGLLAYIHPVGAAYGITAIIISIVAGMPFKRGLGIGMTFAWLCLPRYVDLLLQNRGDFWLNEVTPLYAITQTIQALSVNTATPITASIAILGIMAILSVAGLKVRSRPGMIIYIAVMAPAIIMLIESAVFKPVYFYRPVQPLCISFCMLAAWVIAPDPKRWPTWIAPSISAAILLIWLGAYDPAIRGGHIEQTANVIRGQWQPGDKIVYVTQMTAFPYYYYLPDLDYCLLDMPSESNIDQKLAHDFERCSWDEFTGRKGRTWLVWNRDPIIHQTVTDQLKQITANKIPVASTNAWQFATIEIYIIDGR